MEFRISFGMILRSEGLFNWNILMVKSRFLKEVIRYGGFYIGLKNAIYDVIQLCKGAGCVSCWNTLKIPAGMKYLCEL